VYARSMASEHHEREQFSPASAPVALQRADVGTGRWVDPPAVFRCLWQRREVVRVDELGNGYQLYGRPQDRLKLRGPRRRFYHEVPALDGASLVVRLVHIENRWEVAA